MTAISSMFSLSACTVTMNMTVRNMNIIMVTAITSEMDIHCSSFSSWSVSTSCIAVGTSGYIQYVIQLLRQWVIITCEFI